MLLCQSKEIRDQGFRPEDDEDLLSQMQANLGGPWKNHLWFCFHQLLQCITVSLHLMELIKEEEQKLEAAIEETEKQCAVVTAELKELELKSSRSKGLEEWYWQEFNNFQFQLISHQD